MQDRDVSEVHILSHFSTQNIGPAPVQPLQSRINRLARLQWHNSVMDVPKSVLHRHALLVTFSVLDIGQLVSCLQPWTSATYQELDCG
jgi:hypothetical protein